MHGFNFAKIKKILIVKLGSVGDITQTLPVAAVLRANFPTAEIDWITEEPSYTLLTTNEYLDKILVFPRYNWQNLLKRKEFKPVWKGFKQYFAELKSEKYDLVFDFHDIFRSGLVTKMTDAPLRWGYGTREGNKYFLTKTFPTPAKSLHTVDKHLSVLQKIGLPKARVDFGFKRLARPEFLKTEKPFVVIHPYTGWRTKNWPLVNYLMVARKLADQGFQVYFTGSRADASQIEKPLVREAGIVSLAGRTTILEFIGLTQRATLFIGGDTGPLHIAAANCPVLAIMGPTSVTKSGPYGQKDGVIRIEMDCLGCNRRYCPHNRCMKKITPDMVITAAQNILNPKETAKESVLRRIGPVDRG